MKRTQLESKAWVVLLLNGLYNVAESLCSVFVGVYLYVNSGHLETVLYHYLALYTVTPCVFLLAGWYSQARDRVHVYRLGLVMHAVYYALLLYLREDAASYAVHLGAVLGVTWGLFWAANNTFSYDVTAFGRRDYFLGLLSAITNFSRLLAPIISGLVIRFAPGVHAGYHIIFAIALCIYGVAIILSFQVPHDKVRRPFHLKRALFPGRAQRDWRLLMLASMSQAGAYSIFHFLLAMVMFMQTGSEISVGGFASIQGLAGVVVSYALGRFLVPHTRRYAMQCSVVLLLIAGVLLLFKLTVFTLIIFGFLRAFAQPLFSIPHSSVRLDVISKMLRDPGERIEYICAWEVPLAVGRIIMMTILLLLFGHLSEMGVRIALFLLCANRLFTYLLVTRVSVMRECA